MDRSTALRRKSSGLLRKVSYGIGAALLLLLAYHTFFANKEELNGPQQFKLAARRRAAELRLYDSPEQHRNIHSVDIASLAAPSQRKTILLLEPLAWLQSMKDQTADIARLAERHWCSSSIEGRLIELAKSLAQQTKSEGVAQRSSISEGGDIYSDYQAMVEYLDALKLVALLYPDQERCWHRWWSRFEHNVQERVLARMERFGATERDGRLYMAAGFNRYVSVRSDNFLETRNWWYAEEMMSAAREHLTNFTMFYVGSFDEDIYLLTNDLVEQRRELRGFLADFPNFFFMHFSPTMVMPTAVGSSVLGEADPFFPDRGAKGLFYTMFPRMIPIPNYPRDKLPSDKAIKQYRERIQQIVWRGATTGLEKPYSLSDRFRVVAQFVGKPNADVAFSGVCQGVTVAELPRHSGRLEVSELMDYQVHLDIDGNTNSWYGMRWRLLAGMVIVKARSSGGFVQWYYKHLVSGVTLVEVPVPQVGEAAIDLLGNTALGEQIAHNAKEFGQRYLTQDAMNRAVVEAVRDIWKLGYDDHTKWCVSPC